MRNRDGRKDKADERTLPAYTLANEAVKTVKWVLYWGGYQKEEEGKWRG
jgi:hypothetical protein